MIAAEDGSIVSVIKRSNPSFVCPWRLSSDEDSYNRGLKIPATFMDIMKDLNRISANIDENLSMIFEQKLFEEPAQIMTTVEEVERKLNFKPFWLKGSCDDENIVPAVEYLCDCLDLTDQSRTFNEQMFSNRIMRSELKPLGSNSGIIITYELFK